MDNTQKLIGTLVPMSALFSLGNPENDKGTFASGFSFLDWLEKTHQSAWQLLPLYETQLESGSSTKHVPSPYKSYGIGLDPKYLPSSFTKIFPTAQEKNDFISDNREWIHDYALFCALRDHFQTDDWRNWDSDLRSRNEKTLAIWSDKLAEKVDNHITTQWQLHKSYKLLREKAKKLNIMLIGDLPFYSSIQSPIVWAHQDVFQIGKDGKMHFVSGIPNTQKAHFGRQVWGHPLYNWGHPAKVVAFWKMRLSYLAKLFDHIRFDHAKGFFAYGVIDTRSKQKDRYEEGPGADIFKELIAFGRQNDLSVFTEDSGDKTETLLKTLKELNIPGIKIFRFALQKNEIIDEKYADISHYPQNCVAYTTTHDTETLLGYLYILTTAQKQRIAAVADIAYDSNDKTFAKNLRDAIIASPAQTVIIPIQDWLLTTDRINVPGTELPINDPNWSFRLIIPIENLPVHF